MIDLNTDGMAITTNMFYDCPSSPSTLSDTKTLVEKSDTRNIRAFLGYFYKISCYPWIIIAYTCIFFKHSILIIEEINIYILSYTLYQIYISHSIASNIVLFHLWLICYFQLSAFCLCFRTFFTTPICTI